MERRANDAFVAIVEKGREGEARGSFADLAESLGRSDANLAGFVFQERRKVFGHGCLEFTETTNGFAHHLGMRIPQGAAEGKLCRGGARISHQHARGDAPHFAIHILQSANDQAESLVIADSADGTNRGLAHGGILIIKAPEQQFGGSGIGDLRQGDDSLATYLGRGVFQRGAEGRDCSLAAEIAQIHNSCGPNFRSMMSDSGGEWINRLSRTEFAERCGRSCHYPWVVIGGGLENQRDGRDVADLSEGGEGELPDGVILIGKQRLKVADLERVELCLIEIHERLETGIEVIAVQLTEDEGGQGKVHIYVHLIDID